MKYISSMIAAIGPDTKHTEEVINTDTLYQAQLSKTFAALLGFDFKPEHPAMQPITKTF